LRPALFASPRPHALSWAQVGGMLLLLPATGFLLAFFVVPALTLIAYSVLTQRRDGW
jgi:hypothetical protein